VVSESHINALLSLGVIGFGVALIFASHGAPDLALTQILVETMTVALFMFIIYYLPPFRKYSSSSTRWVDIFFCVAFGFVITWLVLKATALQFAPPISEQLVEWSYPLAKGKNVVNVILVDFRAMDTFGEVIVLAIAAIGVWLCLAPIYKAKAKSAERQPQRIQQASSQLLSTASRVLLPIFLLIALVALYRGHNNPGGGFIGGLIAASGYILISLADGVKAAERVLRIKPITLMVLGLAIALGSSLTGFLGGEYFAGLWLPAFTLPILGAVHLGTPLIFDIGVFLTVIGFSVQVAFSLEQLKVVSVEPEQSIEKGERWKS